jgi:homoserine dehydrogenase
MTAAIIDRILEAECFPEVSPELPPLQTIRVGLAGCGIVGGAFVRLLDDCKDNIAARHGLRIELSRVLVRDVKRHRGLSIPSSVFTNDWASFVKEDVDVVVEAIGGRDTAGAIARAVLRRGRKFVTANKELIASEGSELAALARESDGSLDFGASVGGSAPVISLLRDLLGTTSPVSVRGILNGTSNYLLTQIERGNSFARALSDAQHNGFAELDPSRDLDGRDGAAKLAIIAWISFGIAPFDLCIPRIGLNPSIDLVVRHASQLGGKVRFLAECAALPSREIIASVEPVIVQSDSPFGRTELEDNRVEVDLGWAAPLAVSGPGAGGPPTATALLGDLLNSALPRNERGQCAKVYSAIDDPRVHRWLLAAKCPLGDLASSIEGSVVEAIEALGSTRVIIEATRSQVLATILRLDLSGIEPSVARLAIPHPESARP